MIVDEIGLEEKRHPISREEQLGRTAGGARTYIDQNKGQ